MIDLDDVTYCNQCETNCLSRFIKKEEIPVLNQNKSVIHFSPGQVIIKQGSFDSKIINIQSGIVKLVRESKNGNNTLVKLLDENNFLTFPVLECQRTYPLTAIALTEVEICEINESFVRSLIIDKQLIYALLLENCYSDKLFLMNRLHIVTTRNSHGKLAASLMYLNNFSKSNISIFDFITRKDLAELSSISLESVNKILQELKNDQIITMDSKGIRISKLDLIVKLSQNG